MWTHSSVDGLFGCFHLLGIVNNAAMNTGVEIDLLDPSFDSSGCVAGSRSDSLSLTQSVIASLPVHAFHCPTGSQKRPDQLSHRIPVVLNPLFGNVISARAAHRGGFAHP